jgi:2,3-bisphosphoglycerate-dependent phosphoglycerate mutase
VSDPEDRRLPPSGFRQRGPKPSGTRMMFIRHGESYANAKGLAGGPIGDGGLTPLGRRQVGALLQRLLVSAELSKAGAFYTSALPRAIETGEMLRAALPKNLAPVADASFNEISVGEGDGLPWAEYVERYGAPDWDLEPNALTAPGGESLLGFHERCREAIERTVARHPEELVVVVCHGGVIEQAMKIYQGVGPEVRLRPRIENCSMTEIEFRESWRRLLRYNDRAPLPAE